MLSFAELPSWESPSLTMFHKNHQLMQVIDPVVLRISTDSPIPVNL